MIRSAPLLAVLAMLGSAAPARAQINILSPATLPVDAGAPSARSLAMGGAFIGLADDATTTVTNPAGLRLLGRREIAVEFRTSETDISFALRGRRFGSPTGIGVDTIGSVETGSERHGTTLLPTFGAFAFPSSRWAAGFYWHGLAGPDFGSILSRSEGLFVTHGDGTVERLRSHQSSASMTRFAFGGAVSVSLTRSLSVGVGFHRTKIEMRGRSTEDPPPSTFAPADFGSNPVEVEFGVNATPSALTFGVSWTPVPAAQVGVVHRRGVLGTMDVSTHTRIGSPPSLTTTRQTVPLAMPDRTGAGVAVRLGQGRLAMDAVHVRYSKLSRNFVDGFAPLSGTSEASFYRYPDVFEVHAGGEYLFTVGQASLAARAGWWHDPAHEVVYGGANLAEASRFPLEDRGKHHVTAGAGVLVGRLEFDIGFDRSSSSRTLSLGLIARF